MTAPSFVVIVLAYFARFETRCPAILAVTLIDPVLTNPASAHARGFTHLAGAQHVPTWADLRSPALYAVLSIDVVRAYILPFTEFASKLQRAVGTSA